MQAGLYWKKHLTGFTVVTAYSVTPFSYRVSALPVAGWLLSIPGRRFFTYLLSPTGETIPRAGMAFSVN